MKKLIILSIIVSCFITFGKAQGQKENNSLCQTIYSLIVSGDNIFAGTADGGVFLSSNNGSSWVAVNNGITNYCIYSLVISGSSIYAGTRNGVFVSSNNGTNWTALRNGLPANTPVMSLVISGNNIFAGTSKGVYLSTVNENNWVNVNNGLTNTNVYSLAVSGSNIFAGTNGGGVFLSSNNGNNWNAVNKGLSGWGKYVNVLAINGSYIFAGTAIGVYFSFDNGSNWNTASTGLNSAYVYSIEVSEGDLYIGTFNSGVYFSSNNGSSWTALNKDLPSNTSVYSLAINGGRIFAGTIGQGLYLSLDEGRNWAAANNGLTRVIAVANTINEMESWDRYPSYDVYESMMNKFQIDYPNLFKRFDLVTLPSGRRLIVGKLTNNVNVKAAKPQFLYSATMHGNEPTGFVTMLRYINYLLTNYETDSQVANIVDNIELWILPVANPDGTYRSGNSTVTGASRYNANNVDLNRNYPSPNMGSHPDGNPYQTETQTMMNFADTMSFVMSANFHSGHENVYFPWDSWDSSRKHPDDLWWRFVSTEFADTCQKYGPLNSIPSYFTEYPFGILEGGDEKVLYGTRADYMTYFKNCREFTPEVSYTYLVGSDLLPNYWNSLYRSLLHYPIECLNGVQGVVTDSCTGKPLRAKVFVNNHDIDNSWVYSGSIFGNYYRPIEAGTWSITYSAIGYQSKTINNISSIDRGAVIINVTLKQATPESKFTYSCNGNTITFVNTSNNGISYLWDFGDGNSSILQNPEHTYMSNGSFTVQLTVTNGCGTSISSHQIINLTVGINNQTIASNIEIFPNPTNSFITLIYNSVHGENMIISIVDIIGNKIYEKEEALNVGSNRYEIDLSKNIQGVYIIQIVTPSKISYYKVIKKDR